MTFIFIRFRTTDKHIFESCHTVFVRNCILVNSIPGKRSTEKMELHTFNKVIRQGLLSPHKRGIPYLSHGH